MVWLAVSETGLVREDNQDHVLADPERGIFAVADGMGGGAEGAFASEIVCEELAKVNEERFKERLKAVEQAIGDANRRIYFHATEKRYNQMGSTVAALVADKNDYTRAAVAHVGDSRVYRLHEGKLKLLTTDHTLGAKFGKGREDPLAHLLTQVVGGSLSVFATWAKIDLCAGDRFLICSDGVHDLVSDEEIGELLIRYENLEELKETLSGIVVSRGAHDNYSFVLIDFHP